MRDITREQTHNFHKKLAAKKHSQMSASTMHTTSSRQSYYNEGKHLQQYSIKSVPLYFFVLANISMTVALSLEVHSRIASMFAFFFDLCRLIPKNAKVKCECYHFLTFGQGCSGVFTLAGTETGTGTGNKWVV